MSKWPTGKDYTLCNVPLWFKSYRIHFAKLEKKVWVNKLRKGSNNEQVV